MRERVEVRYVYKGFYKRKGTLGIHFYDKVKNRVVTPVVQFSLKKPWWFPKIDLEYFKKIGDKKSKNGYDWIAGWIFFYLGICVITE